MLIENYEKMKRESIELAKEMEIIYPLLSCFLRGVPIELSDEELPKGVGFGHAYYSPLKIKIYKDNVIEKLPKKFKKIFSQVGMDHEVIGHLGNFLMARDYSEKGACKTEYQMARYRSEKGKGLESLIWKVTSYVVPIYQSIHKKVKFKDYLSE